MTSPLKYIKDIHRESNIIFLTAVLLSFGTNLIASYYFSTFKNHEILALIGGLTFLVFGCIFIRILYPTGKPHHYKISGAFACEVKNKKLEYVPILGYEFNYDFFYYLNGFFSENKPFFYNFIREDEKEDEARNGAEYHEWHESVLGSMTEFLILHKLGLHLNEYFSENEHVKKSCVTLNRDDLSSMILKNPILESITKRREERNSFMDDIRLEKQQNKEGKNPKIECVSHSQSDDGAVFDLFELELPPNSKIKRIESGAILIETEFFDLEFISKSTGFCTFLDSVFIPPPRFPYFCPLLVQVDIKIAPKKPSILLKNAKSVEMYEWIDSFIEDLYEYMCVDRLKQKVNPEIINNIVLQALKMNQKQPA